MRRKADTFQCPECLARAPMSGESRKIVRNCSALKNCLNQDPIDPRTLTNLIVVIEDTLMHEFYEEEFPDEVKTALRLADEELTQKGFYPMFTIHYST